MANEKQIKEMVKTIVRLVGDKNPAIISKDEPEIINKENYLSSLSSRELKKILDKEYRIYPQINLEIVSGVPQGLKEDIFVMNLGGAIKDLKTKKDAIVSTNKDNKEKEPIRQGIYAPDGFNYEPGPHAERLLTLVKAGIPVNILLTGPTGCGKTEMVKWASYALADHFNKKFPEAKDVEHIEVYVCPGSNEMSIDYLLGGWTVREGNVEWRDGILAKAAKHGLDEDGNEVGPGAFFVFDEFAANPENILIHLNTFLADTRKRRVLDLPNGEEVVSHSDFKIFATGNTVGRGLDVRQSIYTAQGNPLDGSTLNRFTAILPIDYNETAENHILKSCGLSEEEINITCQYRNAIREKISLEEIEVPITTRDIKKIGLLYQVWGNLGEAIYFATITPQIDEISAMFNEIFQRITGIDLMLEINRNKKEE